MSQKRKRKKKKGRCVCEPVGVARQLAICCWQMQQCRSMSLPCKMQELARWPCNVPACFLDCRKTNKWTNSISTVMKALRMTPSLHAWLQDRDGSLSNAWLVYLRAMFRLYWRALLKKLTTRDLAILDSLLMIMSPMTCVRQSVVLCMQSQ